MQLMYDVLAVGEPQLRKRPQQHCRTDLALSSNAVQPMLSTIMCGAAPAEISKQLSEVSSFTGHVATADDVANAIAFLASSEAAAVTGVNLLIDTGLLTGIGGKTTFGGAAAAASAPAPAPPQPPP